MMQLDVYVLIRNEVPMKMSHKCLPFFSKNFRPNFPHACIFKKDFAGAGEPFRNISSSSRPEMSICLKFC